ncbi:uncharacterized protein LOC133466126 isoform X3 [Phyllopteryx taeniolatus]|uniref:uncharacterized protein LOC133466126 isoform X3 n=1 Tax=Phyllopteryx taeniolatus TaxID=161469 RepID=UPI002AD57458|nr:uncharacterized protein LOC133466126 isoform X3 [Phyllopteryx taeniolatus]
MKTSKEFGRSAALCFTETWLCEAVPDGAVMLPSFHLHRPDRVMDLLEHTKGGGICFYINEKWCTDISDLSTHCSPHFELLFLNWKPFYSPRASDAAAGTLCGEPSAPLRRCQQPILFPKNPQPELTTIHNSGAALVWNQRQEEENGQEQANNAQASRQMERFVKRRPS